MGSPGMGLQHLAKLRTKPSVPLMASGVSSRLISSTLASEAANKRRATKGAKRLPVPIYSNKSLNSGRFASFRAALINIGSTSLSVLSILLSALFNKRSPKATDSDRRWLLRKLRMFERALPVATKFNQAGLGRALGEVMI